MQSRELPEGLSESLKSFLSFPREARQAAEIARLRALLGQIETLARERPEGALDEIFALAEGEPNIDLEDDIAWMRENFSKKYGSSQDRGLPAPSFS